MKPLQLPDCVLDRGFGGRENSAKSAFAAVHSREVPTSPKRGNRNSAGRQLGAEIRSHQLEVTGEGTDRMDSTPCILGQMLAMLAAVIMLEVREEGNLPTVAFDVALRYSFRLIF